ncbi:MAG: UvrB/UvrC motif-containing protein [Victivallales bacterium]|nr:UvrB/UvrC motif-containing protein [Victivallales bacterium]MCF7888684.1 UvrB/UvrC motif-containing protein [Victivallales bacterium]
MLCEICKKKEAVVHIQEIVKGRKKTVHMCQDCAASKGVEAIGMQGINIAEILYNLSTQNSFPKKENTLNSDKNKKYSKKRKPIQLTLCPNCKWDSEKFQKTGRLGCEKCYEAFSDIIIKTISNIQKGNLHIGKRPGENTSETSMLMMDILNLQKQLEACIAKEEFEKAAEIRDKLNGLKNRLETEKPYEK